MLSRRAHRAHAGSGRASRAPPRRPRASRSRRSARWRACARRARSPCAAARRSAVGVAVRALPLGPDDGVEDALLVALELRPARRARRKIAGRGLHALERVERRPRTAVRLGPRRDDQPRLAVGKLRPDLLGHVRHAPGAAARAAARARRAPSRAASSPSYEPRLDRLGVPVAEVVEGQVVERVAPTARSRSAPSASSSSARVASSRARIQRSSSVARPRVGLDVAAPGAAGARRSRACSRACAPPRSRPRRSARPGSRTSSAARSGSRPRRARSITSSGSMPVPRLFDIRRPSGARIVEVMITSVKGTLADQLEPGPDHPVLPEPDDVPRGHVHVARVVAPRAPRSRSGQPSVANGQSADENHVSSTSGSRSSSVEPHSAQASGRRPGAGHVAVRAVPDRAADGPTRAGARCSSRGSPRASGSRTGAGSRGGSGRAARAAPRAPARAAPPSRTTTGARSAARCACGSARRCRPRAGSSRASRARRARVSHASTRSSASSCVSPASSPASSVIRPSGPITVSVGQAVVAADVEVHRIVAGRDLERAGAEARARRARRRSPARAARRPARSPPCRSRRGSARRRGARRPRRRRGSSPAAPSRS